MAVTGRKRDLLSSRRRTEDEGEDDEGAEDLADDTQSEASILTVDEVAAADESDLSERSKSEIGHAGEHLDTSNGTQSLDADQTAVSAGELATSTELDGQSVLPAFSKTADMDVMLNGLKLQGGQAEEKVVEFEDTERTAQQLPAINGQLPQNGKHPRQFGASARYQPRAQRNIPTTLYTTTKTSTISPTASAHTTGSAADNNPSMLPQSIGRGRGRGKAIGANGSVHPQHQMPPVALASDAKWSHDLHETILEAPRPSEARPPLSSHPAALPPRPPQRPSMSKTVAKGVVPARVFFPNMNLAKVLEQKIPVREHTRLPDLRPPLRRDKPVRISIPNHPPRYIFPTVERSFIFIPRAQRPNQQAKMRRGYGSRSGSRRTSVYAGSAYSPSIAMSRRSSFIGNGPIPLMNGMIGRPPLGAPSGPARPVVRFPMGQQSQHASQSVAGALEITYPLPSEPARREHRSSQMTMHQPRPQKQMSVASIEGEQQAFHQQLPYVASSQEGQSGSSQVPFLTQPAMGTPLQNIPESAINAQPFEPANPPPQSFYYPMQPMYYYPPPESQQAQYVYPQMASPVHMPPPPPYYVPMMMPMHGTVEDGGTNTYMQETNGMVYFYDSANYQGGDQGPPPMMAPHADEFYPSQPFYQPQ